MTVSIRLAIAGAGLIGKRHIAAIAKCVDLHSIVNPGIAFTEPHLVLADHSAEEAFYLKKRVIVQCN